MEILCGDDSVGGFATVYCGLLPDREEKREHTDKRKYRKMDIDRNCTIPVNVHFPIFSFIGMLTLFFSIR